MTSPLATNSIAANSNNHKAYYLQCDKNHIPIELQVAKSFETYSGAGNQTVVPSGTDTFFVNSLLAGGVLTLNFTAINNYIGRNMRIVAIPNRANNIVLNFAPINAIIDGAASAVNFTIAPAATGSVTDLAFFENNVAVI